MKKDRLSISRYPDYKDSAIEWLGEVPEHWEALRIKDVGLNGLTNGIFKKKDDFGFGVKLINVSDLYQDNNLINYERLDRVNATENEVNKYIALEGDIFFVRSSLKLEGIGISALLEKTKEKTVFECHIIRFRPDSRSIHSKLLKYILNSEILKSRFIIVSKTVTMTTISQEKISSIELVLPPLSEQKAIAHYLDTKTAQIDRKIDLLTQKAERYGNLKQSLINETVTRGFDRFVPMKDSEGEWFDCVPSDWNEKRVKDLFRLVTDVAPDNNDYELLSVYASIGVRPRKDLEQRGNKASTTDGYWIVKKGDIVVNKLLAWMGSIGLSNYEGVTSPAYDVLRKLNNDIEERFYGYLFRTGKAQEIFKKSSRGIMDMRLRLYFDKLGAITVPVPPIAEQIAIADYLDTKTAQIDRVIQTINTQVGKLKELRKTLINDVVTGKIKVV
jgi:type I restriction enzyme, S subunit